MSMPGKNGVVLSDMIEKYPGIAMIAVVLRDDYDYVIRNPENGAHDYILNPDWKNCWNGHFILLEKKSRISPWEEQALGSIVFIRMASACGINPI